MHRNILCLLMVVLLAGPAWAGGAAKDKKPEPGTTVEMPFLIIPMNKDGNLLGYTYVSPKLVCASVNACIAVREKLAFIQDAYVRDVNGRPLSLPDDPVALDKDQLCARLTAAAKRIVGDSKVVGMKLAEAKYMPLRPSESTTAGQSPDQQAAVANGVAPAADGKDASGKAENPAATSKTAGGPAH
jgi:hypothetical protein